MSTIGILPRIGNRPALNKPLALQRSLKQSALLFDQLTSPDLLVVLNSEALERDVMREVEWLVDNKILLPIDVTGPAFRGLDMKEAHDEANRTAGLLSQTHRRAQDLDRMGMKRAAREAFSRAAEYYEESTEAIARGMVQVLRAKGENASALFIRDSSRHGLPSGHDTVVSTVIHSLPEPDDATPWEAIFDFRQHPDAVAELARIKAWMHRAAKAGSSRQELADEIEHLLHEYERYLTLQKIAVRKGILETVVTTSAEVLESAVRLKLSQAAKAVFDISRRDVALLSAEQQAPGRDLAFISRARKTFRR